MRLVAHCRYPPMRCLQPRGQQSVLFRFPARAQIDSQDDEGVGRLLSSFNSICEDPRVRPFLQTGRCQNKRAQNLFIRAYALDHDFGPLTAWPETSFAKPSILALPGAAVNSAYPAAQSWRRAIQ